MKRFLIDYLLLPACPDGTMVLLTIGNIYNLSFFCYLMKKNKEFYKRISQIGLKKRWEKEHSKVKLTDGWTKEKAAINAYLCGDGYIAVRKDVNNNVHSEIQIILDNLELCKRVVSLFNTEFNIFPKIRKRKNENCYSVRAENKPVCLHLLSLGKYKSENWNVPNGLNREQLKEWIKCFFDCEAYVNTSSKIIQVKSINHDGLKSIKEVLKGLEINSVLYGPYKPKSEKHSAYSMINIPRKELANYNEIIGFYHKEKIKKLNSVIN